MSVPGVIQTTSTVLGGTVSYFVVSRGVNSTVLVVNTLNSVQGWLDCSKGVLRGYRNLVICRGVYAH